MFVVSFAGKGEHPDRLVEILVRRLRVHARKVGLTPSETE
jgi:hypothetical protein